MGRLNTNEKVTTGNQHANHLDLRMGRLMAEDNRDFRNGGNINELINKSSDTDTERETDDGLLPKPVNGQRPGNSDVLVLDAESGTSEFDVNLYQHKKTLAQGMMDLALFSANANQLRYVLEMGSTTKGALFYTSLILILMSLLLQGMVGIGLIWNGRYNIKKTCDHYSANRANNITLIGIFLITIINVFISAFGIPTPLGQEVKTTK